MFLLTIQVKKKGVIKRLTCHSTSLNKGECTQVMAQGRTVLRCIVIKYLQGLRLVTGTVLGGGIYRHTPAESVGHSLGRRASCS